MKYDPSKDPVWGHVAKGVKMLIGATHSSCGVLLLEKNGGVAAILAGDESVNDPRRLQATLRMFEERINGMANHVDSGEVNLSTTDSKCFLRDETTGAYNEVPPVKEEP